MYCTYVLTVASFKMFLRNRSALFFSLFVPFIIMLIFGAMKFDRQSPMDIGLVTNAPSPQTATLIQQLRKIPALIIHDGTREDELHELKTGKRAAVLVVPDNLIQIGTANPAALTVYVDQSNPLEATMALTAFRQMADQATIRAYGTRPLFTIDEQSVSAHTFRYIEFLLPGLVAMSVMQMSVFSVAFVFAQYREKGILKRILATPVRPGQFVAANIVARLFMSLLQSAIFIASGLLLFHVHMQGDYWLLAICVLLGALIFLGLGFTISGLAKSIDTVPVLANLIVFPMLFLGNVFFPASNMPAWLQPLAAHLPLSYFSRALRAVMIDGAGIVQIRWDLLGLLLWAAALIALAMLTFRLQEREV